MKKFLLAFGILIFVALLSMCLFPHLYLNSVGTRLLKDSPNSHFHIGSGFFNPLTSSLSLTDISIHWGDKETVFYDFRTQHLFVDLSFLESLKKESLVLKTVVVSTIHAHITEGPKKEPPSQGGGLPPLEVQNCEIKSSLFTYSYNGPLGLADLKVTEISGDIKNFLTRTVEGNERIAIQLQGKITSSGQFRLSVDADLFHEINRDSIVLTINNHDLSSMNSFFEKESALHLKGVVQSSKADFHLSQGHLTGSFTAKYEGFELNFLDSPKKNFLVTFIENLVASVALETENETDKARTVKIKAQRKPGETIFQLLLRGLKASALELTSGKSKVPAKN